MSFIQYINIILNGDNTSSDKVLKGLWEEFEQLKQENQDLKSRLAKLEAKAN